MNHLPVLDHGFVKLRNLAGPTRRPLGSDWTDGIRPFDADDTDPANAARMSFGDLDNDVVTLRDGSTRPRTKDDDFKLNEYLLVNGHTSPFEMIQVWLEVRVPIFIDRQLVRHRTWSRNESSGRYIVLPEMWYIPEVVGGKAANKKQGQEDNLPDIVQRQFKQALNKRAQESYAEYRHWIHEGVANEHARMFLHLNHYVHWIGSVDLHNLFHFLHLRCHSHAQIEAQKYGWAIVSLLEPHLPELMKLFHKHCVKA